jgi:hypothetical protein
MKTRRDLWKYILLNVLLILCVSVVINSSVIGCIGTVNADNVPYNINLLNKNEQGVNLDAEVREYTIVEDHTGAPVYSIIEVTLIPEMIDVRITIFVDYVRVGDELIPVYSFAYNGKFNYRNPKDTTIYFPLPSGMITDLSVVVNGELVELPEIVSNNVKVFLAKENSTVSFSFISYGKTSYAHEVPKNDFVKDFYFKAVLKDVETEDISLDESLTPDSMESGNSVTIEWDNENAIMRKDIMIELLPRTPKDNWGFFGAFISGLIFLAIPLALFYYDGSRRLEYEKKLENYIMLIIPYIVLSVVLWAMISFSDIYLALVFSLLGYGITHVLIDEDVLRLKRGKFEFLLIPFGSILLLCGVLLIPLWLGILLVLNSTLLLVLLIALFVKRYPSPTTHTRNLRSIIGSVRRKNNVESEVPKAEVSKAVISKLKAEKKYCPHCGSSVEMDFGFCPKCGMDVSLLESCSKCGTLRKVSKDMLYCPNCGMQKEINVTRPPPPKKWLSLNKNKAHEFEKMS